MSNELRAAAERLENIFAMQATHFESVVMTRDQVAGAQDLARAYLAEHPADGDEPITAEWLRAVGFVDDRTGCPTLGPIHIRPHWAMEGQDSDRELPPYACVRSLPIPIPKTRSDLRKLCSALGIELKE